MSRSVGHLDLFYRPFRQQTLSFPKPRRQEKNILSPFFLSTGQSIVASTQLPLRICEKFMPLSDPRQDSATAEGGASAFKRKPRLLSLLLKAIIMTLITSIFFLFLGLAAIILLHLCLAGGLLRRRSNSTSRGGNLSREASFQDHLLHQHHLSPRPGLSPSDLRRVPKFRFFDHGKQREESLVDCAICLDEVREGQWCRRLIGCGHVFHKGCVDMWLVKVAACPVCRMGVSGLREGGGGGGGRVRDLKVDGYQGLLRL